MARTLPSDLFIPEVATEYAYSEFTERLLLLQMALSGVSGSPILVVPPDRLTDEGERLTMPYFKRMANLVTRRDLTSISAPTPKKLDGGKRAMVVIRAKIGPIEISLDAAKVSRATEADISAEIGRQAGQNMSKYVQDSMFRIIFASLGLTFGGVSHVYDGYKPFAPLKSTTSSVKNTMSLGMLNKGKVLLSDYLMELSTMLLRSEIASDLVELNLAQGYDTIAGYTALTGNVRSLGLGEPIVIDNSLMASVNPSGSRAGSGSGTGDPSKSLFRTLLLGPGCGVMTFPHNLTMWTQGPLTDAEAPYIRILGNFDFAFMLRGAGWKAASPANPTTAEQADSGNYEDVTTGGHKEVLAAVIECNRLADAA